jgi:hypothetical protein
VDVPDVQNGVEPVGERVQLPEERRNRRDNMSVTEQEKLIEDMAKLEEKGQTYLLGVMAGLVAMQESKEEKCCGKCGEECGKDE